MQTQLVHLFAHEWSLGEISLMNETLTMSAEKSLWSGGGAVASPVQQGEVSWVFPVYPYSREGEGGLLS